MEKNSRPLQVPSFHFPSRIAAGAMDSPSFEAAPIPPPHEAPDPSVVSASPQLPEREMEFQVLDVCLLSASVRSLQWPFYEFWLIYCRFLVELIDWREPVLELGVELLLGVADFQSVGSFRLLVLFSMIFLLFFFFMYGVILFVFLRWMLRFLFTFFFFSFPFFFFPFLIWSIRFARL